MKEMEFVRSIFRGASSAAKAKKVNKVLCIFTQKKTSKAKEDPLSKLPLDLLIPKRRPVHVKKDGPRGTKQKSSTNFAVLNKFLQDF